MSKSRKSTDNNVDSIPNDNDPSQSFDSKIVVLGDSGVGKTSIAMRFVKEIFPENPNSTVGATFLTKRIMIDNYKIKLQIWDTAGQERFRSLAPMYYRGAQCAILVFDVTNEETLLKVKDWVKELKNASTDEIILAIVANKVDLADVIGKRIEKSKCEEYASTVGGIYFETSAKTKAGIEELFVSISKRLVKMHIKINKEEARRRQEQLSNIDINKETKRTNSSCCS